MRYGTHTGSADVACNGYHHPAGRQHPQTDDNRMRTTVVNDDKDLEIWQLKAVLLQTQQALLHYQAKEVQDNWRGFSRSGRHRLRQKPLS